MGIVRVETEIARYMMIKADKRICYSMFDNASKILYELTAGEVEEMLSRDQCIKGASQSVGKDTHKRRPVELDESDIYITLGLDWDQKDYPYLYELKKAKNFKVITFCYDLIPVLYPQYCVGDVAAKFAKYFVDLAWLSDFTFCISKCTENDVRSLLDSLGAPLPETGVIHLGCDIKNTNDEDISREVEVFKNRKYILFTSTIERRKNHEAIYKAICRLVGEGYEPPHVVFVGMQGWGVGDLLQDLKFDPRARGRFTMLSQLSDADLAYLYKNCLFAVYPSNYEGWGLPVTECLAYGKFCLVSNNSSLPEAGGDFVDYIDATDIPTWANLIKFYSSNEKALEVKEKYIRTSYTPATWQMAGEVVWQTAAGLLQSDDGKELINASQNDEIAA